MPVLISNRKLKSCQYCNLLGSFERTYMDLELPLLFKCGNPACRKMFEVKSAEEVEVWPKEIPSQIFEIYEWEHVEQDLLVPEDTEPHGRKGFDEKIEELTTHVSNVILIVDSLHQDLSELTTSMTRDIDKAFAFVDRFRKYWNLEQVKSFIAEPYCSLPLPADDANLAEYSRIIITPRFLMERLGYTSFISGQFYFQIVLPYTLIGNEISPALRERLGIKQSPDLKIVGKSIVGKSLPDCYHEIPGTIEMPGHSHDSPMIEIRNSYEARGWLVSHGVFPWPKQEISNQSFYRRKDQYIDILSSQDEREAFRVFVEHGRMILSWRDRIKSIRFCYTLFGFFRGMKAYIYGEDTEDWAEVKGENNINELGRSYVSSKHTNVDSVESLNQIDLLVVDYDGGVSERLLKKLYLYTGKLIILCQDPIMDALEENTVSKLICSLGGIINFDNKLFESGIQQPGIDNGEESLLANAISEMLRRPEMTRRSGIKKFPGT